MFIGHPDIIFSGISGAFCGRFYRSTVAIARVLLALALVLSVASTTSPTQLADGFSGIVTTAAFIHVDVDGLEMLQLPRAIPLTLKSLTKLEQLRGRVGSIFESGSIIERIQKWFTLLVPLTVLLFQPVGPDLAQAMTDHCLGAAKRTRISAKNAACRLGSPAVVDCAVRWASNTVALQYLQPISAYTSSLRCNQ